MTIIADSFRSGYKKGWDKCREELCKTYNLNEKEVFAWECSDKNLDLLSEEGEE